MTSGVFEPSGTARRDEDQRIFLSSVSWSEYEILLAIRGERSGLRIAYLKGELELMTPSRNHETIKTMIARLVETYADESEIDLNGYGSWTLKSAPKERGLEPDECYVLGSHETEVPDLAIEVIWTSGGLDKLEIYRGLGVKEVWIWREEHIEVFGLGADGYERQPKSALLPDLDFALLEQFLDDANQTRATREFRKALRRRK